jgi:hypothetical protein
LASPPSLAPPLLASPPSLASSVLASSAEILVMKRRRSAVVDVPVLLRVR